MGNTDKLTHLSDITPMFSAHIAILCTSRNLCIMCVSWYKHSIIILPDRKPMQVYGWVNVNVGAFAYTHLTLLYSDPEKKIVKFIFKFCELEVVWGIPTNFYIDPSDTIVTRLEVGSLSLHQPRLRATSWRRARWQGEVEENTVFIFLSVMWSVVRMCNKYVATMHKYKLINLQNNQ